MDAILSRRGGHGGGADVQVVGVTTVGTRRFFTCEIDPSKNYTVHAAAGSSSTADTSSQVYFGKITSGALTRLQGNVTGGLSGSTLSIPPGNTSIGRYGLMVVAEVV